MLRNLFVRKYLLKKLLSTFAKTSAWMSLERAILAVSIIIKKPVYWFSNNHQYGELGKGNSVKNKFISADNLSKRKMLP